jgi:hypothetical protein
MPPLSNEEVVRRYVDAHVRHDFDALGSLRSADWYQEWPQTGERVRGHANDQAIMTSWPGGTPQAEEPRIVGSEDRWVLTPAWTYQRLVGSGDTWWTEGVGTYPDGSTWFVVSMFELRDAKIHRETWYFGPKLEAPEWRSAWVERMDPPEPSPGR